MTDGDLKISISIDASGVSQGAEQAKTAIAGIGPQIQSLGKTFEALGASLKSGLDGLGRVGSALSGLAKSGGDLQGVSASVKTMGDAIAGVGREAPTGLNAVTRAASEVSAGLATASSEGASKLAMLGEAAGGVASVALAIGQVAASAATATAEWAARTQDSSTASAAARQNAANLNGAIEDAGKQFGAVGDTLANAFAPVLASVVNALTGLAQGFETSYQQGGAAKTIVDALILVFKLLAAGVEIAITAVIAIIEAVRGQIQVWKDDFGLAKDVIVGGVDDVGLEFQTFGRIVQDVLSGDFHKAVGDFNAGLDEMAQHSKETLAKVQADLAKIKTGQLAEGAAVKGVIAGGSGDVGGIFSGQSAQRPVSHAHQKTGHGAGASSGGGSAGHAPGSDACACDPAATADAAQQSQAANTAAATQSAEMVADICASANVRIKNDNNAVVQSFTDGQQKQVDAAQSADAAKVRSNATANTKMATADKRALADFKKEMDQVVSTFSKGLTQMIEGQKSFGQVMRTVGQLILNDALKIVDQQVEKWAWGVTENVLATSQGQALLNALGLRDLAQAILIDARKTASAVGSTAAISAAKKVAASTDDAQALQQAMQIVRQDAGKTFAGIFAALSQNPVTLPLAAPLAAAGQAAVLGVSLTSAAGGFDIPAGLNPLTQLHAKEMVLPARLANPMRDMLANFSAGQNSAAGAAGDVHNHTHNWSVSALDGPSVERFLRSHGDRMVKVLNERVRANAGVALGYAR